MEMIKIDKLRQFQFGDKMVDLMVSDGVRDTENIYMDRYTIGNALEYSQPIGNIRRIHMAHREIIDPHSRQIKFPGDPNHRKRTAYTLRGVLEITRFSTKPKANQFMNWVWSIIERLLRAESTQVRPEPVQRVRTKVPQPKKEKVASSTETALPVTHVTIPAEAAAPVRNDDSCDRFYVAVKKFQAAIDSLLSDLQDLEHEQSDNGLAEMNVDAPILKDDTPSPIVSVMSPTDVERADLNSQAREMVDVVARKRNDGSLGFGGTLKALYSLIGIDVLQQLVMEYTAYHKRIPRTAIETFETHDSLGILSNAIAELSRKDAAKRISAAMQS